MTHGHLGDTLPQLGPLPFAFVEAWVEVVQLTLHFLLLVLQVLFGAGEWSQVSTQICRLFLQSLLGFLQTSSHLHREEVDVEWVTGSLPLHDFLMKLCVFVCARVGVFVFTLLACSSCSVSSSTAWPCFCLRSWICDSWLRPSSSMAFFNMATSCSRFALPTTYTQHIK